ncbi:hypothetical protein AWRI3578_g1413 [Hanseniaspora opuntiae]|uniref:Uncharacterized protein n=1 Tax=Hanseniaspora opuntiae TaxID=211096 RepID=A0A1E5RT98_9ASCO|nr:hypothetical protein AWRI3578_g1413 [Hanseniaspora opuntiae]
MKKGKRMNNMKIRALIDKKAKEIADSFRSKRIDSGNMLDGVDSPPQSSVVGNMVVDSTHLESYVDKVENKNNQASTSISYTNPASQEVEDWQVERKRLSDKISRLEAEQYKYKASAVRKEQNELREYAWIIVNRVGKNYTFNGEEEDPQRRVEKYIEFRNKIEFAIDSQSMIRPEVEARAIRKALFSILKGYALSQYQTMANQNLTIEQILKTMDQEYDYRTDLPTLFKRALETCIYDDRCKDNTILVKAHVRWLRVIEATKGWSVEKIILELMKGELIGAETTKRISELGDCDIDQFFDELYTFDSQRNQNMPYVNTDSLIRDSTPNFEVNAVSRISGKRVGQRHTWQKTKNMNPSSYERICTAFYLSKNIKNSEANKNVSKSRFEMKNCLYCGKGGHAYFKCTATKEESGYFWR